MTPPPPPEELKTLEEEDMTNLIAQQNHAPSHYSVIPYKKLSFIYDQKIRPKVSS